MNAPEFKGAPGYLPIPVPARTLEEVRKLEAVTPLKTFTSSPSTLAPSDIFRGQVQG